MRRIFGLVFIVGLMICLTSFAQTTPCDSVYMVVDEVPTFGNSDIDLSTYIAKNLKFGTCGLDEMKLLTWGQLTLKDA